MRHVLAVAAADVRKRHPSLALLACTTWLVGIPVASAQTGPALPSGGRVTSGDVAIGAAGPTLTVTQTSPTAIVDWSDFSIGAGGTVRFDNGQGATLNRVDGVRVSRIDGALLATGSVYLINPRGVIVGRNGVVDVGGSFVASTLDIPDANFSAGGDRTFSGASKASVVNLGRIGALGGDVALIAATIDNRGSIAAPNGSAALAAGSSVLIRDAELDGGRFVVLVGGRDTSVTNSGVIGATVAELRAAGGSIYALAGNISGTISADQVTGDNGRVFLTAGDGGLVSAGASRIVSGTPSYGGTVELSGDTVDVASGAVIDVSATSIGGQVYVTANRTLSLAGTVLARGSDQGGSVWTFGRSVDVANATVDTRGATVGSWIVAQPSLTVDSRLAGNINRFLRTTNLEIDANPADFGEGSGDGNLTIAAPFTVASANQLTLLAANVLRVDQNVTVAGSSVLNLDVYGSDAFGAPIVFAPNRSISFTGPAGGGQALNINADPYALVYSVADLQAMAADPAGRYAIARSFSASATPLTGPAVGARGSDAFSGIFEGLGHSINGLRIVAPGQDTVGLFGVVSGTIRNVSLVGGSVVGGSSVGALVGSLSEGTVLYSSSSASVTRGGNTTGGGFGGLVGFAYLGQIAGSSASGAVYAPPTGDTPGGAAVGGLVGGGYGLSIVESFATGNVTGGADVGGLVGSMSRSGISGSFATGAVSGGQSIGGLVGLSAFSFIDTSQARGRVSGSERVGGLVGYMLEAGVGDSSASGAVAATLGQGGGLVGYMSDGDIARSSASGRVTGGTALGGLVGAMIRSTLADTAASGAVTASGRYAGGLVGEATDSDVVGGWATGAVRGTVSVGGLIGSAHARDGGFGNYTDSRATGAVSGVSDVGGLVGSAANVRIARNDATGTVTGSAAGSRVGGLIGALSDANVSESRAEGRVTGARDVGGLIGSSVSSTLYDVVARGPVNGTLGAGENVGGLIGHSERTDIDLAAATNSVRGRTNVGGLIGRRTGGTLGRVSATGPVTGTRNVEPLIGLDDPAP